VGFCPSLHPRALGIFKVGIAPCDFAAGMTGATPQASTCGTPCILRTVSAAPPMTATTFANTSEKLMELPVCQSQKRAVWNIGRMGDSSFTIYRDPMRISETLVSAFIDSASSLNLLPAVTGGLFFDPCQNPLVRTTKSKKGPRVIWNAGLVEGISGTQS